MKATAAWRHALKINDLIDSERRWPWLGLVLLMIVSAGFDLIGMAGLLNFMQLVVDPQIMQERAWLQWLYRVTQLESAHAFVAAMGVALLLQISIANATGAVTVRLSYRLAWSASHRLAVRLLSTLLGRPYEYFSVRNTAGLSRTLLQEVWNVVGGVLLPATSFASRLATTVALLGFLSVMNPVITAVMSGVLGGSYCLVYFAVRRKQGALGELRLSANAERYRVADEALRGIKVVKVAGCEGQFISRFEAASSQYSRAMEANQTVARMPRYALETVVFGSIVVILLVHLGDGHSVAELIPTLSVYTFAAYKLMPALTELFASFVQIRFNLPALDELHRDLAEPEGKLATRENRPAELVEGLKDALCLRSVSYSHPGASSPALEDVSLRIEKNRSIGIVGPTGSGKSTLIDVLLGLLAPQFGQVEMDGRAFERVGLRMWRAHFGYVPQDLFLLDDSIAANVAFGTPASEVDHDALHRVGRIAQLDRFVAGLTEGWATRVGERGVRLSGGERQRIAIARALYHDPDILVLDEATSALDGVTERAVIETMQTLARKKTMVVVAHRLATVRECDCIHVLDAGRIVASGTYDQLVAECPQFRDMLESSPGGRPG